MTIDCFSEESFEYVAPAKAGAQVFSFKKFWIPACAGTTDGRLARGDLAAGRLVARLALALLQALRQADEDAACERGEIFRHHLGRLERRAALLAHGIA